MPDSYGEAVERAQESGFIDPHMVERGEIRSNLENFLNVDNDNSQAAQRLIEGSTEAAMRQTVRRDDGAIAGRRGDLKTWRDVHGNIMYHNSKTGNRKKLVDKDQL